MENIFPRSVNAESNADISQSSRDEFLQRDGVHAVTESARRRPIREDVPQMGVAGIAGGFHAFQESRSVKAICNRVGSQRLCKGRPASTRLEFFGRVEENGLAAETGVDAGLEQAAHLRTERMFGTCLTCDAILLGRQLAAPFFTGFGDLPIGGRVAVFREIQYVGPCQRHALRLMPGKAGVEACNKVRNRGRLLYVQRAARAIGQHFTIALTVRVAHTVARVKIMLLYRWALAWAGRFSSLINWHWNWHWRRAAVARSSNGDRMPFSAAWSIGIDGMRRWQNRRESVSAE
jgi:hypothetical protein